MEMPNINLLSITPIYIALLGILFVPFTMRVGLYRVKNEIIIGDGKDEELIRRIRGQGNFRRNGATGCSASAVDGDSGRW